MAPEEAYAKLLSLLSGREEVTLDEACSSTGLGREELENAVALLRALGFVEVEEGLVRWLGPEVRGRVVIVRGKIDYVLHSPFEVRVFGLEELRATAKPR